MSLKRPSITCSIVSHNQNSLVNKLLDDFQKIRFDADLRIILTQNIAKVSSELNYPSKVSDGDLSLQVIHNPRPLGFGANHNQAFRRSIELFPEAEREFFCILNPDIRFSTDCFAELATALKEHPDYGIVGPTVLSKSDEFEDFARYDPSLGRLVKKLLIGDRSMFPRSTSKIYQPDWIAGMFMMFSWESYTSLQGFDEEFFLYYEDADICKRARSLGFSPSVVPWTKITHEAQRESHRNLGRAFLHFKSMVRYLIKHGNGKSLR